MSPLSAPPPPTELQRFPRRQLSPTRPLYRIHWKHLDALWFASDGEGRFDLAPPLGTCYAAEGPIGAFIEVFRDTTTIPAAEIEARRVAQFHVPRPMVLADCGASRARAFGVTAAIHSDRDYSLMQAWAAAFVHAGFDGIRYRLSHDPSQRCIGIALFGGAGVADWPTSSQDIDDRLVRRARGRFGIRVLP